jgi:hypothetical protein
VSALACAAFAAPPAALANDFQKVYDYYKHHGTIRACQFSESQLKNAERETPPDVEQYAPSFLDALGTAREQSGSCGKAKAVAKAPAPAPPPASSTPAPTPGAAPTASVPSPAPVTTTPQPVATVATPAPTVPAAATTAPALHVQQSAAHDSAAPVALWTLAGLAVLMVLAAIAAAVAWFVGWYPDRWLGPGRGDTGRELADWLRSG